LRAVLDVNVLVSALLTPEGVASRLLLRCVAGDYELIASPLLIFEFARVLKYPKLRAYLTTDEARQAVGLVRQLAREVPDPNEQPRVAIDPADDHLFALASTARAVLVSGDRDVLNAPGSLPLYSPRAFLDGLDT
jgi:putative PIN family toxin of toxin-antitoxin system